MRLPGRGWRCSSLWLIGGLLGGHASVEALQVPPPVAPQAAAQPALPPVEKAASAVQLRLSQGRVQELSGSMGRLVEAWMHQGDEDPGAILKSLGNMAASEAPPPGMSVALWRQNLWHAQALIAARTGDISALQAALQSLRELDPQRQDARIRADQALALAQFAVLSGEAVNARAQAQSAQQDYALVCSVPTPTMACSLRAWWYSLEVLTEQALAEGRFVQARTWATLAQQVARRAGDEGLEANSVLAAAYAQHALGQYTAAQQTLHRLASPLRGESLHITLLRWRLAEVALNQAHLSRETQLLKLTEAWELSQQIGSVRWMGQVRLALARYWLMQRPQRALVLAQDALQTLHRFPDVPLQAQLTHVMGLARTLLRQTAAGQADLSRAQDLWRSSGAWAHQAAGWREASVIFESLGRIGEALQFFHEEQSLRSRIEQDNRRALVAQLREQFEVAAKLHQLEQLSRLHRLEQIELEHQALVTRLVVIGVTFLVLVIGLMLLLAMRARDLTRRLRRSEGELRLQSERDALTGLVNRRYVSNCLQNAALYDEFQGGVLLLDIDHFKRINDELGHAAGDAVLVEVSTRLQRVVGEQGLVSRWGGEEFLVWVDDPVESLDALAQRILHSVGDVPIRLPGDESRVVTISLGYGLFPSLESDLKLGWERALKLVDMLLYAAKQRGRDQAMGLQGLSPTVRSDDIDALSCQADIGSLGDGTQLSLYRRKSADFCLLTPRQDAEALPGVDKLVSVG